MSALEVRALAIEFDVDGVLGCLAPAGSAGLAKKASRVDFGVDAIGAYVWMSRVVSSDV